jgi:Na+-transporting NADH:ubiquinone oxidoreductase subunit NqrA
MTPPTDAHLVELSVHLPNILSPQKISCLEWDEEAMALCGFWCVIIISYMNLNFIILKGHMLVSIVQ